MQFLQYFLIPEWGDEMKSKKCKRKNVLGRSERKKKVALVSGKTSPLITISVSLPAHCHSRPISRLPVLSKLLEQIVSVKVIV